MPEPGSGALSRGVALTVIELPPDGEPWPADLVILDPPTVDALIWCLDVIIDRKDRDLPGMELLAATLGAYGPAHDYLQMKRRREILWTHRQLLERMRKDLAGERAVEGEGNKQPPALKVSRFRKLSAALRLGLGSSS